MTQRFTDRVAIVTGAGGGIGEAYARALHAEGASVVIAELNKEAGAAVAADLGERALFVHTDVGDLGSCEAMAAAATEAFGGIDHLVNNAAIFGDMEGVGITTADPTYVETFMRVNVLGATYCTGGCPVDAGTRWRIDRQPVVHGGVDVLSVSMASPKPH